MGLCQKLEASCLDTGVENSLELSRQLRWFRGHLKQAELKNAKQATLDSFVVSDKRHTMSQ